MNVVVSELELAGMSLVIGMTEVVEVESSVEVGMAESEADISVDVEVTSSVVLVEMALSVEVTGSEVAETSSVEVMNSEVAEVSVGMGVGVSIIVVELSLEVGLSTSEDVVDVPLATGEVELETPLEVSIVADAVVTDPEGRLVICAVVSVTELSVLTDSVLHLEVEEETVIASVAVVLRPTVVPGDEIEPEPSGMMEDFVEVLELVDALEVLVQDEDDGGFADVVVDLEQDDV